MYLYIFFANLTKQLQTHTRRSAMHNWLIGYYIVEFEMTIPSLSIAEQGDSLYIVCYLRRALSDFKNLRSFSLFTNTTSGLSRTALTRLLLSKAILPFVLLE